MKDMKVFWFLGALVTIIVFMFVSTNAANFAFNNQANNEINKANVVPSINPANSIKNTNSDVQVVKLSMKNYQYSLEPSSLKKGVPVRMEVDLNTVVGCGRSIIIPAFGVRKSVNQANKIIEFTPDKAGTFTIACSMNMYRGQFTVLESDGTRSDFVDPAVNAPPAAGCGGGSGGCGGCGGGA